MRAIERHTRRSAYLFSCKQTPECAMCVCVCAVEVVFRFVSFSYVYRRTQNIHCTASLSKSTDKKTKKKRKYNFVSLRYVPSAEFSSGWGPIHCDMFLTNWFHVYIFHRNGERICFRSTLSTWLSSSSARQAATAAGDTKGASQFLSHVHCTHSANWRNFVRMTAVRPTLARPNLFSFHFSFETIKSVCRLSLTFLHITSTPHNKSIRICWARPLIIGSGFAVAVSTDCPTIGIDSHSNQFCTEVCPISLFSGEKLYFRLRYAFAMPKESK